MIRFANDLLDDLFYTPHKIEKTNMMNSPCGNDDSLPFS